MSKNQKLFWALFFAGVATVASVALLSTPAISTALVKEKTPTVTLQNHKGIYDFDMVSVAASAGISGISGQMYYEQDDTCEAYTSEHRFSIDYQYPEQGSVRNSSHYVAWEAKDFSHFYFNSTRQGAAAEQLRGEVIPHTDGTGLAEYSRPEEKIYHLAKGYVLPTEHTMKTLQSAMAGKTFYHAILFDGTDEQGPAEVNTFIGKPLTKEQVMARIGKKNKAIDQTLLLMPAWPMHMAFFVEEDKSTMVPAYEMDIIMHANGIISDVVVDYGEFKVRQKLTALSSLPAADCK